MITGNNITGDISYATDFYVLNGTLPASTTWTDYYSLPTTWTDIDKIVIMSFNWYNSSTYNWCDGQGVNGNSAMRIFIEKSTNGIRAYTNNSVFYSTPFRVVLAYLD